MKPDTCQQSRGSSAQVIVSAAHEVMSGLAPCLIRTQQRFAAAQAAVHFEAEKLGIEPMARLVAYGHRCRETRHVRLGPVSAVQRAVERAGRKVGDIERIDVNVDCGAIAHGHPIDAAGAVLAARLLYLMRRDSLKPGIATPCVGGGQVIAVALEALS